MKIFLTILVRNPKKSEFSRKGKTVISVKIRDFSRYRMKKWTSSLESSREICLQCRIPRQSEFHVFRGTESCAGHLAHCEWIKRCHVSCAE